MATIFTNRHPLALTIALLITAQRQRFVDFEHSIQDVLAHLIDLAGWSDERKADLYALIAEKVTAGDSCIDMERKLDACLWKNEEHFRG